LQKLYDGFGAGQVLCDGIDTVIVGRPNVGKSTLMNLLSGTQKSIVTAFAGTTRDIVEDTISLHGIPLHLADTAGLRESTDPIEQIGVERTRERLNHAQLILAVFDSSESLTEEDQKLLQSIGNVPAVAVINKADLQNKLDEEYISKYIKQKVYISALKGEGIEALTDVIKTIFHTGEIDPSAGILFTERQKDVIRRALECTKEARDAFLSGMTLDAVTVSVEGALSALLEFTGERVTDAVVEEVFKNFCVGK
jgi:tRNA modification GTPase